MRDTLCIIPARSGSKGIKDKNILMLNKKELFLHSINFAKKLKFVKDIVFSTDSSKYIKISKKSLSHSSRLRPKAISQDNTDMIKVIRHELNNYKGNKKEISKILILQPTCPFRSTTIFNKANNLLKQKYDSVITLNEVRDHPERMKLINSKNHVKNFISSQVSFKRRQSLQKVYIRSGSMYFFKAKNILKSNNILGKKIYGIIVKGKEAINIDNYDDFVLAKSYSKSK